MSTLAPALVTDVAASIAAAELRLAMLRRLAQIGMALAEEIGERAIQSPYHPEPRHEPGRAFATVSRAVRLTLVLEAKVEAWILASRNGEAAFALEESSCSRPDRAPIDEGADEQVGDDHEALDRSRESLVDSEAHDAPPRSFRECVEAIRADLGLSPDWSDWPDDAGFAKPDGADTALPVTGTEETKQGEARGGEASITAEPSRPPQIPPPRSAPPNGPSP